MKNGDLKTKTTVKYDRYRDTLYKLERHRKDAYDLSEYC